VLRLKAKGLKFCRFHLPGLDNCKKIMFSKCALLNHSRRMVSLINEEFQYVHFCSIFTITFATISEQLQNANDPKHKKAKQS